MSKLYEFAYEILIQLNYTQKTFDRALKELSNGIQLYKIRCKIVLVIGILFDVSFSWNTCSLELNEFAYKTLFQLNYTQKTFDRALKELSNGIQLYKIRCKIVLVIGILLDVSFSWNTCSLELNEFAYEIWIKWNYTQKTFDRALKELPNDI